MAGPSAKVSTFHRWTGDFCWAFVVPMRFSDTRLWLSTFPCSVDSWAGVDKTVPFKLRVSETTRAEREGRAGKSKGQVSGDEVAAEDREAEEGEEDDEDDEEGAAYCSLAVTTPIFADLMCSLAVWQSPLLCETSTGQFRRAWHLLMQIRCMHACSLCSSSACAY